MLCDLLMKYSNAMNVSECDKWYVIRPVNLSNISKSY